MKFDDEYRAGVVVMLQAEGYPDNPLALGKVHKYLAQKAPYPTKTTISNWFHGIKNPPPSTKVDEKKEDMAEALENVAWKLINHVLKDETVSELTGVQPYTGLGIVLDKLQLLKGEPTAINEQRIASKLPPLSDDTLEDVLNHFSNGTSD